MADLDLIPRLRALSRSEHMDLSIVDEAADEIEDLIRQRDRLEWAAQLLAIEVQELEIARDEGIGKRGERLAKALIGKRRAEQERNDAQELLRRAHRLTSAEGIADWNDMAAPHIEAARQRRNG